MEYLIRFSQSHETFRLPEIQALAVLEQIDLKVVSYSLESPFCVVQLTSEDAARRLIRRSILTQSIHELWGSGVTLSDLNAAVRSNAERYRERYTGCSFRLRMDSYHGSRAAKEQVAIFNTFSFLDFLGAINMSRPDQEFTVFEEWTFNATPLGIENPNFHYFGRHVGTGARELVKKLDLKKRRYISTTSMDAELALVTANMALAAPGKLVYDPFVGTGSFPIACAQFGALAFGSDIDGRSIRGDPGKNRTLRGNFEQYGLLRGLGGMFSADLTNTPIRRVALGGEGAGSSSTDGVQGRLFDGILCDPPYGVREGLRVLGVRDPEKKHWIVPKGKELYKNEDFIPPKKPYSFLAMLDDILQFAAETLVDDGRLAFWMPTANDEEQEIAVPTHPYLEIVAVSTQVFNKWSRRLITYRRIPNAQVNHDAVQKREEAQLLGKSVDELNPFRRGYFTKFETPQ